MRRPALISGVLRLFVVGVGGAAVVLVLRSERAKPSTTTVVASEPVARSEPSRPQTQSPGTWAMRAGGWYIRVDGAEIAIPSLAELTAARPRASLAFSISPYDHLILYHARAEGLDWRLVAAVIFEESRFDPASRSDKGAYGLMQVRPIAAEAVGATHFTTPADNVQTGTRYLRHLERTFHDAPARDRLRLVLAAYNMGPGHVRDAQTLARRFGYDANRWDDAMDLMLPLLEQPSIYQTLPNGFAKGTDTIGYVERILDRYQLYQNQTAGAEALSSSEGSANHG